MPTNNVSATDLISDAPVVFGLNKSRNSEERFWSRLMMFTRVYVGTSDDVPVAMSQSGANRRRTYVLCLFLSLSRVLKLNIPLQFSSRVKLMRLRCSNEWVTTDESFRTQCRRFHALIHSLRNPPMSTDTRPVLAFTTPFLGACAQNDARRIERCLLESVSDIQASQTV